MRIAFVEDCGDELHETVAAVDEFFGKLNMTPEKQTFVSAQKFLEACHSDPFDIVFMDIYLEKESGMEAAKELSILNLPTEIIFVSSSTDFLLEGYSVHPAGYVLKPTEEHKGLLNDALKYALQKLTAAHKTIALSLPDGPADVVYSDILWIESYMRSVTLYLKNGDKLTVSGKYSEIEAVLLLDERFLKCGRAIIVNMDNIKKHEGIYFIFNGGRKLEISRRLRAELFAAHTKYILKP